MAPLLILVVRLNPLTAVGVDLLYSVPTKLLGALVHWRQGSVNRKILLRLILGGIPGAAFGPSGAGPTTPHDGHSYPERGDQAPWGSCLSW